MNPAYIVVALAFFLACAPLLSSTTERGREKSLDRYARRMNLALTGQVRPRVVKRIMSYERAAVAGGICGVAVGFAVGLALPEHIAPGDGTIGPLLAVIGLGVGVMASTVTTATIGALRPVQERRIARLSVPGLGDYVPALERWFAPITLGCAGLALAGGVIALGTGVIRSDGLDAVGLLYSVGAILGYLGLATYLVARILARRILGAGQPATAEQELAWDDALRANSLRGLFQLPSALAGMSVLVIFAQVAAARTVNRADTLNFIGGSAFILFIAGALTLIVADLSTRPSQHYWRQLWRGYQQPGAGA